jgi:signal transduction histidine kinase
MYSEIINNQLKEKAPESTTLLNKISENSKEMIGNMSDIVWAIKPSNDSFRNIEDRMFNFATELCNAKEIELRMSPNNELEHLKIPMEHRRDLYLIFKEAVNNAVKYSACTILSIHFDKQGNRIQMQISDNGKGFDLNQIQNGNGLGNMKRRAEMHGWELEMSSEVGKGTEVRLRI